jgi:hypothetical protein
MDFIRKPILFRTHNELSTADTLPKNTTRAGLSPTLASPRGTQKKTVLQTSLILLLDALKKNVTI